MSQEQITGLLNLNKPKGLTSRRVVDQVQRLVRPAAAGHAGTLDPLATGVLVVCVGRATRLVEYVQRLRKRYRAVFRLGATSDTDDVDGNLRHVEVARPPTREEVQAVLPKFVGKILQRPPAFSAVHVGGRRAYELARRGERVEPKLRTVSIHALKVLSYEYPNLQLDIECGSGTYVRAIGRDLGERLGCGAVMESLARTAIGSFLLEDAVEPSQLSREGLSDTLLPMSRAVEALPRVSLAEDELRRFCQGQSVSIQHELNASSREVAVVDADGSVVAIASYEGSGRTLAPKRVLLPS